MSFYHVSTYIFALYNGPKQGLTGSGFLLRDGTGRDQSCGIGKSGSQEKSKNRKKSDKIGKIGSDFLSDFLAKMPKCHKLP